MLSISLLGVVLKYGRFCKHRQCQFTFGRMSMASRNIPLSHLRALKSAGYLLSSISRHPSSFITRQSSKIMALTSGGNFRNAKGDSVIVQLRMEQSKILVSWSLESIIEEQSIIQFESRQLLKFEPEMIDPWISTRLRVHDIKEVLRSVVPQIVESTKLASCRVASTS
jgi:hypothetical protein